MWLVHVDVSQVQHVSSPGEEAVTREEVIFSTGKSNLRLGLFYTHLISNAARRSSFTMSYTYSYLTMNRILNTTSYADHTDSRTPYSYYIIPRDPISQQSGSTLGTTKSFVAQVHTTCDTRHL